MSKLVNKHFQYKFYFYECFLSKKYSLKDFSHNH